MHDPEAHARGHGEAARDDRPRMIPAVLAPDLLESHLAHHAAPGRAVYTTVLLLVAAAAAALPLVHVDVTVQADGIVRPASDKHEVRSGTSGVAERSLVRENQRVRAGEPMLLLRAGAADAPRAVLLAAQREAAERAIHDLSLLVAGRGGVSAGGAELATARYRGEAARFAGALREGELRRGAAARDAERTRMLASRQFAASSELAAEELRLAQAEAELETLRERQLADWQGELAAQRAALAELRAQGAQLAAEREALVVRAPVSGTVEQVARLAPGSFVQSGEVVAVVSPELRPVAELFVLPRDVGLLRVGAAARMQIDAFNYRDWGLASGRVASISGDFLEVDGRPMFKVRCTIDSVHLVRSNGARGEIRKGMTVRARFTVARRSVLQLLRDGASDWLTPAQAGA